MRRVLVWLGLVAAAALPGSGAHGAAAGCPASPVHYERLSGGDPSLATLPWIAPSRAAPA